MNARTLAAEIARDLSGAGIPDARFEAELLAREAGRMDRAAYFAGANLSAGQMTQLQLLVERRLQREPAAYIFGRREFYGLSFEVTPAVLIPRPETELLVDLALAELRDRPRQQLIDIGTGSGCIAVAIAANTRGARITGVDASRAALDVARANARQHGTEVGFVHGNLTEAIGFADIVVANLPYIPADDIASLAAEVRDWEPRRALDGGSDGLALIRSLIHDCASRLRPRLLALEVGLGQAGAVARLGVDTGARVQVSRDLAGIERVVCLRWA